MPEEAKRLTPDDRFSPPETAEERFGRVIRVAMQGEIDVRYLSVDPATLVPQAPAALENAKASLINDPSLRENMLRDLLDGNGPTLLAYRNGDGSLCAFDDYLTSAIAQEAKLSNVQVMVLGEGDEGYTSNEAPSRAG